MEIIIIVIIAIAILRVAFGRRRPIRAKGPQASCPYCLQLIPAAASACFHCGHDVMPTKQRHGLIW